MKSRYEDTNCSMRWMSLTGIRAYTASDSGTSLGDNSVDRSHGSKYRTSYARSTAGKFSDDHTSFRTTSSRPDTSAFPSCILPSESPAGFLPLICAELRRKCSPGEARLKAKAGNLGFDRGGDEADAAPAKSWCRHAARRSGRQERGEIRMAAVWVVYEYCRSIFIYDQKYSGIGAVWQLVTTKLT